MSNAAAKRFLERAIERTQLHEEKPLFENEAEQMLAERVIGGMQFEEGKWPFLVLLQVPKQYIWK